MQIWTESLEYVFSLLGSDSIERVSESRLLTHEKLVVGNPVFELLEGRFLNNSS